MTKVSLKFLVIAIIFSLLNVSIRCQTTLISPTRDGGFETGTTLSSNNWTVVNAATNTWQVGTAATAFAYKFHIIL